MSDRVMPNEKWRPGGARLLPRAVSERAETSNMDEHCVDDTSKWLWHQS